MVKLNIDIPDDFYKEEIICGYQVTEETKKIWAVELDLLNQLLSVCKKHNIEIYSCGGTMLGAVRHHGFIPWDNDIDMMMKRSEYNKLCSIASDEFQYPYFFQTEYTDPGSLRGHAQLRRSDTTAALKADVNRKDINQGLFIDIFPHDVLPDDKDALVKWRKQLQYDYWNAKFCNKNSRTFGKKNLLLFVLNRNVRIPEILHKGSRYWYQQFESNASKYSKTDGKYLGIIRAFIDSDSFDHSEPAEYYENFIECPFEMLKVLVPVKTDEALTAEYGNWREYKIGGDYHGEILFDTDHSYKELLKY